LSQFLPKLKLLGFLGSTSVSDNIKTVWAPRANEEVNRDSESPDVGKERAVVAKAYPHVHGWDRRIAFLFEHKGARFFRVNFHDPENHNFISRSHFVEVRGDKADEWPVW
jgi:hypothetical protein